MTSLSRHHVSPPTTLLLRILERPGLVAAVRELPGAVLGKLIDRIGLEDAGDLVVLASTTQSKPFRHRPSSALVRESLGCGDAARGLFWLGF